MQWIVETIESPATGSLDAGLDQGSTANGSDAISFAYDLLNTLQAIRGGDFSVRMAGNRGGLAGEIAETLNAIAAANQQVAHQLRRVCEDVGREGRTRQRVKFGLPNGAWGEMEESINTLIDDLTWPVTALTRAVAAVAQGDLSHTLALGRDGRPLKGEFLQAATVVNAMMKQLRTLTSEVVRVAREVGTEGKLGGHIRAGEAAGVWKDLTNSVNAMASNLAAQVRNIADVAIAAVDGDLSKKVTVDVRGALAGLRDSINAMIASLRLVAERNIEEDWVETNLAKFASLLEGQRDISAVGRLLLSELTPLLDAQLGVIYRPETEKGVSCLKVLAAYADDDGRLYSERIPLGAGVIGQCAIDKRRLLITQRPTHTVPTGFSMFKATPQNVVVLPVLFRKEVKAVIELASVSAFTTRQMTFLEQLAGRIGIVLNDIETATETEGLRKRLQESEDQLNLALAAGKMGSWDWDLVEGACVWDEQQKQIFGVGHVPFEVALSNIMELVDRRDWKMLCRLLKRVRQDGGAHQAEFRVRRPDGSLRWCLGRAAAITDASGRVSRVRGVTIDITERKEAEDRQSLLAREVDHRTKNALSVVHAIVSLTRAEDIKQFSAAVEGRIAALARAHSLLSDSRWRGAKIADLIHGELAPYRTPNLGRVRISGKSLSLHPSAVQALALAVHELATNAAKYGALSMPSGSVEVTWEAHDDRLELRWIERGGPPSEPKTQGGFGMRVIKASVEAQLSGAVEFDWQSEGLQCVIRVPSRPKTELFDNFLDSSDKSNPRHADRRELGPRRRIPLIRDESFTLAFPSAASGGGKGGGESQLVRLDLNAVALNAPN
ncbi:MAG TPA: HWE histidine kinase domain-containing protein [Xanthobacteraceae bacterium]|jgi:PAS domain S-box-containing protein|nr:HWE histidine kinase domain-containing protein [Xanthobacteraceae bacterium]